LIIWGLVVVIVSVVDYIVPIYFTKVTGGSKYAERGPFIGFIAGTGIKTIASVLIMWQIIVYLV
jgi:uncharacterized protein YqgC (DUF456 family)